MAGKAVSVKSLADLKQVKREIEVQAKIEAGRKAERAHAARQTVADRDLFTKAVGKVQPVANQDRLPPLRDKPAPLPLQHQRDERAALQESMSDEFDVGTLLDVDGELSFARPGVGPDVTRKLRQGHWSIQRQLDLHGLRSDEAREVLGQFIRDAHRQGLRCLRVIHGKGLGSPGKTPVLKNRVHSWLAQKNEVLAFVQARPADGGAGALLVLLQPSVQ